MIEVEATVYNWTALGMRTTGGIGEYIEKREAERLLEAAYRRGYEAGYEDSDIGVVR